eukprot:jgi/Mesen1/1896/ME000143S00946
MLGAVKFVSNDELQNLEKRKNVRGQKLQEDRKGSAHSRKKEKKKKEKKEKRHGKKRKNSSDSESDEDEERGRGRKGSSSDEFEKIGKRRKQKVRLDEDFTGLDSDGDSEYSDGGGDGKGGPNEKPLLGVKDQRAREEAGLDWMLKEPERPFGVLGPEALEKEKEDEKFRVPEDDPDKPKISARELNPFFKAGGDGNPPGDAPPGASSKLPPGPRGVGDGGASWRLKALRRAQEQAAREGKSLEELVQQGSLVQQSFMQGLSGAVPCGGGRQVGVAGSAGAGSCEGPGGAGPGPPICIQRQGEACAGEQGWGWWG